MDKLHTLLEEVTELMKGEFPGLAELRRKLVELDDFAHSPDFDELSAADRSLFQKKYRDLRELIKKQDTPIIPVNGGPQATQPEKPDKANTTQDTPALEVQHTDVAEQRMEEAEKLFYGGRYAEAILFYDQVLQIDPRWERAQQHRRESENYLRTGYIPSVALPPDAASAFGKAQSAARLGRYADALSMLNRAQIALKEVGIQRWQDGQEFEQKLQQYIDAESVYNEGVQLFNSGNMDDGIERVDSAAQATGLPRYIDRTQEMRRAKAMVQSIAESLNSSSSDAKVFIPLKANLETLVLQFGENPAFQKLKDRFQALVPVMVEPLKDQVRSLKTQADRGQTLDAVTSKARQAKEILDQIKSLGYSDDPIVQFQEEIDRLFQEAQRYEDELQQAFTVYNANRSWPAAAAQISQNVRARYPNDPRVVDLNRSLTVYRNVRLVLKGLAGLAGLALVIVLLVGAFRAGGQFLLSLTPSPSATRSPAPTATPLPPTATFTPGPTNTPTITPTPQTGVVARTIWARNGCYETYRLLEQIPAGSTVKFLPAERRFDNLGRECLLIEYTGKDKTSQLGWILILDLK
ncbi:MAG: tetratricopeptide repeat protein [Anaerolineaceae bacterium]